VVLSSSLINAQSVADSAAAGISAGFYFRPCLAHALTNRFAHFSAPLLRHALLERIHDVNDLRRGFAFVRNCHLWGAPLDLSSKIFVQSLLILVGHSLWIELA
jgi:hypothetical protein